jgi:hypothetical protein
MTENNRTQAALPYDNFPKRIPFVRWLFLILEAGLAVYFALSFRLDFGILFLAYGIVCLFLIFPLIRCVRCSYYGKRCNFGWGRFWISNLFPKIENEQFGAYHGWSIFFWPLRIIPIFLGAILLPNWILGKFEFVPHGLFIIYLVILFSHRRFYRARACVRCRQRDVCPVYSRRAMAPEIVH